MSFEIEKLQIVSKLVATVISETRYKVTKIGSALLSYLRADDKVSVSLRKVFELVKVYYVRVFYSSLTE